MSHNPKVLLLTVGTGDVENPEATLLAPLRKSMRKGTWKRIVLLPSRLTEESAERLRGEPDLLIEVRPLAEAGQENDADACFAHFASVIADLRASFQPQEMAIDFTRGTKAMSAALLLAAVRHGLPTFRYITTSAERDRRGMVVPGTEVMAEFRGATIYDELSLEDARKFALAGDFGAALSRVSDPSSQLFGLAGPRMREEAPYVYPLLTFYRAWDRLNYDEAAQVTLTPVPPGSMWAPLAPGDAAVAWVRQLAEPLPEDHALMASRLRALACDLLANGERRLRGGQIEDAMLRAYRVAELIGQFRLFDHGLDSGNLRPDHPAVQRVVVDCASKNQRAFGTNPDGETLNASREQVARLLRELGDPMHKRLFRLGNRSLLQVQARNRCILVHGFETLRAVDENTLRELYKELESILVEDDEAARDRLAVARSADLSKRA